MKRHGGMAWLGRWSSLSVATVGDPRRAAGDALGQARLGLWIEGVGLDERVLFWLTRNRPIADVAGLLERLQPPAPT